MDTIKFSHEKKPLMVAHRGCSYLERENTAAAFVAAGNRSYFGIETDVHRTADGRYICIHDDRTGRVAGDDLPVEQTDFDTLRALTLLNRPGNQKDRADLMLPSLSEYIGICEKYEKTAVLELKNPMDEATVVGICREIEAAGNMAHVIFISFCYENLLHLRRHYPRQAAQFLVGRNWPDDLLERLTRDRIDLDADHRAVTRERVAACHKAGVKVNVWTVDDPAVAADMADYGVDFITSNCLE